MKQLLFVISFIIIFSMKIFGQIHIQIRYFTEIPKELLSNMEKIGVDSSLVLNDYEGRYFNCVFKIDSQDFNLVGKKVYFSFYRNKIDYFADEKDRFYHNKIFTYEYDFNTSVTHTESLTLNYWRENTCSNNRYAYCLNNPLKYTDPDGEKWWHWLGIGLGLFDPVSAITTATAIIGSGAVTAGTAAGSSFITGVDNMPPAFIAGIIGGGGVKEGWRRSKNAWKLMGGLFASDEDKSWNDRLGEIFSRHTYQQPFTNVGYWFANIANITGEIEVDYFHGATVTKTSFIDGTGGITLGSNIMLSKGSNVDFGNATLIHEYGHYLQQRKWGATPYLSLSLASILSAGPGWRSVSTHNQVWSEMDASARGLAYFESRMDLRDINNFTNIFQYRDYYNGRFLRNYFANDILTYLLLDITWSN